MPTPHQIQRLCDSRYGLGADGVLCAVPTTTADFALRIFNSDGGEAEISGNGLRIFARYLWDHLRVTEQPFTIATVGRVVTAAVCHNGRTVSIEMGAVRFAGQYAPPADGPIPRTWVYHAVTLGNPHCVLLVEHLSPQIAQQYGPHIERDSRFPQRTNVQFVQVLDRHNIRLEIWERGAGYTLSSGSSSCAAAAVTRHLGHTDAQLTAHMPGGPLTITIAPDYHLTLNGPVEKIGSGTIESGYGEATAQAKTFHNSEGCEPSN